MAEIQIRNVSKDFLDASGKPFHALKDISFTWNKGENISFTGESGSGDNSGSTGSGEGGSSDNSGNTDTGGSDGTGNPLPPEGSNAAA